MPADLQRLREAAAERWADFMMNGNFHAAWQESAWIESTGYKDPHRLWNGESWHDKCVMVRCLHGLGDAIQFIRYARLLRQTCRSLIVQSHPELVEILRRVPGVDEAVTWNEREDSWDTQIEVMELPRLFHTSLTTIPADVPYIRLPSEQREWAAARVPKTGRPNVGLVWQASSWNPKRSIPRSALLPLLQQAEFCFYNLQKEADDHIPGFHAGRGGALSLPETAALAEQMDLIISVDTMAAHLAGALARPVWILLPADADWRWMRTRRDSPWYPTATLFRQQYRDNWPPVIDAVAESLTSLSARTFCGAMAGR